MNIVFKNDRIVYEENRMLRKLKNRVRLYVDLGDSYKRCDVLNFRLKNDISIFIM